MLHQQQGAVGDRGPARSDGATDDVDDEGVELAGGQAFRSFGLDEVGHQVVAGRSATFLDQAGHDVVEGDDRLLGAGPALGCHRVGEAFFSADEVCSDLRVDVVGQAEEPADHPQGERCGEVGDDVERAPAHGLVEQDPCMGLHQLAQCADTPRAERAVDDGAQTLVLGAVERGERQPAPVVERPIVDAEAVQRVEPELLERWIARQRFSVVGGEQDRLAARRACRACSGPSLAPGGIRIAPEGRVAQVDDQRLGAHVTRPWLARSRRRSRTPGGRSRRGTSATPRP